MCCKLAGFQASLPRLDSPFSPFFSSSDSPEPHPLDFQSQIETLRQQLESLPVPPGATSRYGVIGIDCFRLLADQLLNSQLQGFDLCVLLFLLGHFNHKFHAVPLTITEIAEHLHRHPNQINRAIRKLETLSWLYRDERKRIWFNPLLIRSANRSYQAIAFRGINDPGDKPRAPKVKP